MDISLWTDVAAQIGFEVPPDTMPRWTYPWLMTAFDHLAKQTGCKRSAFRRKVCDNLSSQIARIDSRLLKMREQEVTLVNQMQSDRDHATAVSVFSTENAVAKIQHAENHLSRQLERSLAMLERLQSNRRSTQSNVPEGPLGLANLGAERSTIGFVFKTGTFPSMDRNLGMIPRFLPPHESAPPLPSESIRREEELQPPRECVAPSPADSDEHSAA